MLRLAFRALSRRPARTLITLAGLAVALGLVAILGGVGEGYAATLRGHLDRSGVQMMLVPLGCPYDAAARVLHGKNLEHSLPAAALVAARRDPQVAVAAPMLAAALPRPAEGRTDMWVGLDREGLKLRPWWKAAAGEAWFPAPDTVILGAEAAAVELRRPGDLLRSPEAGRTFRVAGVLERSGTSDDSLFFVPLATAQAMFGQEGRLTAVALRLKDPTQATEAAERLQKIPGAQVVTLTEMMGTFVNLLGGVRALLLAAGLVALAAGALGMFNTLFGAVVEQISELAVLRALGASRGQVFTLVAVQGLLLSLGAVAGGLGLALAFGGVLESAIRPLLPLTPGGALLHTSLATITRCAALGLAIGLLAGLGPAWRASRVHPATAMRA